MWNLNIMDYLFGCLWFWKASVLKDDVMAVARRIRGWAFQARCACTTNLEYILFLPSFPGENCPWSQLMAVPSWSVWNIYKLHGCGGASGSAVEVKRPAHALWWERLGFHDRDSHIKAQLRTQAMVSKGDSNVWVDRYLLFCLSRKLHNLLNRVFQCMDYPLEALVRLCSCLKALSGELLDALQEEIPHSGDDASPTPLGPAHPTSRYWNRAITHAATAINGSLPFSQACF